MSLFDYPARFPSPVPGSVSGVARIWCMGGLWWLCFAFLCLALGFLKKSAYPDLFLFWSGTSTGVLLEMGKAALIYGAGLPLVLGSVFMALVEKEKEYVLSYTGGWIWHLAIMLGLGGISLLKGSGVEGMSFASYIWPVLILALLPAVWNIARSFCRFEREGREEILFLPVMLGFFLLLGGFLFVFILDLPAYYRGVAAGMTAAGILVSVMGGMAVIYLSSRSLSGMSATLLYILFSGAGLSWPLIQDGMPWGQSPALRIIIAGCLLAGPVLVFLSIVKKRRERQGAALVLSIMLTAAICLLCFAGQWERASLFFLMGVALFTLGTSSFLADYIPRCTGREWIMRKRVYGMPGWIAVSTLIPVALLLFFHYGPASATRDELLRSVIFHDFIMALYFLSLSAGFVMLFVNALFLWYGAGRIVPSLFYDPGKGEGDE